MSVRVGAWQSIQENLRQRARDLLNLFSAGSSPDTVPPSVRELWLPKNGQRVALVRWFVTEWCNYRCPYCPQTHNRRAEKGEGMTAHAFDNFPLKMWQEAFDRHFADQRLSLVITGGEPMVDRRNMGEMLRFLSAKPNVECIRIDTNAWWRPDQFLDLDRSKIILMCTFHPSQISEADFHARMVELRDSGFEIGMINYVMDERNAGTYEERRINFAEGGFVLHPNPLWSSNGSYSEEHLAIMDRALPEFDFRFRTGQGDPNGMKCIFPAIGYELDYKGVITAGCQPDQVGSFFGEKLPFRPESEIPCPYHSCVCLDKYSFLDGIERNLSYNPLHEYSKALKRRAQEGVVI